MACHTEDGYRSMKKLLAGRDRQAIGNILSVLHGYAQDSPYRTYMPPLVGLAAEVDALGDYLATLTRHSGETDGKHAAMPQALARKEDPKSS